MPLPLPPVNAENLQFIIDQIATRFPIQNADIANGVLKLAAASNVRTAFGAINDDGTTSLGSGFSATQDATGQYTITFDTPFSAGVVVTLGVGNTTGPYGVKQTDGSANDGDTFEVSTFDTTDGALTDCAFHFHAIGPA